MDNINQNDEQARQMRSNTRLAWVLGVVAAAIFVFVIYYLRAK
ncbi:hypothetical protein [Sulfuricella sp.]|nr:hypothetical protein [Sulfuricella sp.]HUX62488.1 hypothetical protein [Sulfuricella sp.]